MQQLAEGGDKQGRWRFWMAFRLSVQHRQLDAPGSTPKAGARRAACNCIGPAFQVDKFFIRRRPHGRNPKRARANVGRPHFSFDSSLARVSKLVVRLFLRCVRSDATRFRPSSGSLPCISVRHGQIRGRAVQYCMSIRARISVAAGGCAAHTHV